VVGLENRIILCARAGNRCRKLSTEAWLRVKNYIFRHGDSARAPGLIIADYEPPGNGGFLLNGGRPVTLLTWVTSNTQSLNVCDRWKVFVC